MGLLDELKKNIKSFRSFSAEPKTPKRSAHPRDNVAKLIENSIELLNNPNYKVTGRKGATVTPEVCYEIKDGTAKVQLSYSRQLLKLNGEDKFYGCDASELQTLLQIVLKGVKAGEFDDQLLAIQDKRKKSQQNAKRTKKKS